MKRKRPVAIIQPGQVAIIEVDNATEQDCLEVRQIYRRQTGSDCLVFGKGVRIVGVANFRPWKRAH